jgi:hypothetical protein
MSLEMQRKSEILQQTRQNNKERHATAVATFQVPLMVLEGPGDKNGDRSTTGQRIDPCSGRILYRFAATLLSASTPEDF